MPGKINDTNEAHKGNILAINTGSATTKLAYFSDGERVFDTKLEVTAEQVAEYPSVMNQAPMRSEAIENFMKAKGISLQDIDIVMARGGLFSPAVTGVYRVNEDMKEVLISCRDGSHACNLSAVLADDIAAKVNAYRKEHGLTPRYGDCGAYIADPPMADEMIPECRLGGTPEFSRGVIFHALNSRAIVRRYARDNGKQVKDITAIVAHMGGGVTVSLHRGGRVIDTSHGLGGDGPITSERAGGCSPFQLIDICYSGKYTKEQVKFRLVGGGGAVAYFGTNSMIEVQKMADEGNELAQTFLRAYVLNISKYIAAEAATADGKVDVIILTGGVAYNESLMAAMKSKVGFLAPVAVYPGEDEMLSLAENGYMVLEGKTRIREYDKNQTIEDLDKTI